MIQINNLTKNQVNQDFLKKVAQKVLKKELKETLSPISPCLAQKKKKGFELSIALVGQAKIKSLNKKYRKKNKATDVLSFFYGDSGELVICLEEVRKNARRFDLTTEPSITRAKKVISSPFQKELTKILIHGILHLMGYDHEKGKKKAGEMQKREEYYLSQFKNKL